jgi:hypothetical protein
MAAHTDRAQDVHDAVGVLVGAAAAAIAARNQNAYALVLEASGGALGGLAADKTPPVLRAAVRTLGAMGRDSRNPTLMPEQVRAQAATWLRTEADAQDRRVAQVTGTFDRALCVLAGAVLRMVAGGVAGYVAAAKTQPVVDALLRLERADTVPATLEAPVLSLDAGHEPLPDTPAARAIKARLERFISQIRPTDDHIEEANRQTNFLIDRLHDKVDDKGTLKLEKILRAGSNAKHTALRRTAENAFDVDLGAYFSGSGAKKEQLDKLLTFTRARLIEVYGDTKSKDDFEKLKSAVRITFKGGIKLQVDVAPIVSDASLKIENGGWIPRPDDWRLTSVTRHIDFIHERSARAKVMPGPVKFNRLVRLIKWWNNAQGDDRHPTIILDLLTAAAFDARGVTPDWPTSVRGVFQFLRRHQLKSPVIFGDNYTPASVPSSGDLVTVLDPVNKDNNVTRAWKERDRTGFLRRVDLALDAIADAHACLLDDDEDGAIDAWSRVFGPDFRALSEPEKK